MPLRAALDRSQDALRASPGAVRAGRPLKRFYVKAYQDNITGMAAMVAYNLLLSIFPLALIALFITSQVLRSPQLQASIFGDLQQLFPNAAESTLTNLLNQIRTSTTGLGLLALATSIWICTSFWGALDTAFARIYHTIDSRRWLEQKRFALAMLLVSLLFIAATVAVPALQSILVAGAADLPLGLGGVKAIVFVGSLVGGVLLLFGILTIIYRRVPYERVPWYAVWPGALGATAAITVVDYAFPAYLSNISNLAGLGTTLIFIVIVLLWFYVMAIIVLGGAVINSMRYEDGPPPHRPRGLFGARRRAGAMVQIVREPESESGPGEAARSKQVADVVLPREELDRIWSPVYLERLAATYWRFLERVSLHLLHIEYGPDSRAVKFLFIPLLTFHAPEYETSAEEGTVTWRIKEGFLVAPAGRGSGHLRITVSRAPEGDSREAVASAPGKSDDQAILRVSSEVANFYPTLAGWGWAARMGRLFYRATQLRIHVIVTHGFLRSLARMDLAESRVGSQRPPSMDPPRLP